MQNPNRPIGHVALAQELENLNQLITEKIKQRADLGYDGEVRLARFKEIEQAYKAEVDAFEAQRQQALELGKKANKLCEELDTEIDRLKNDAAVVCCNEQAQLSNELHELRSYRVGIQAALATYLLKPITPAA